MAENCSQNFSVNNKSCATDKKYFSSSNFYGRCCFFCHPSRYFHIFLRLNSKNTLTDASQLHSPAVAVETWNSPLIFIFLVNFFASQFTHTTWHEWLESSYWFIWRSDDNKANTKSQRLIAKNDFINETNKFWFSTINWLKLMRWRR